MRISAVVITALASLLAVFVTLGCGAHRCEHPDPGARGEGGVSVREDPFVKRPLHLFSGGRWIGGGVAYGPHRDGQYPGGPGPSREELREDLRIMSAHWGLLRLYGAAGPAEIILGVIRDDGIDMKVMLGVWIQPEDQVDDSSSVVVEIPGAREANRGEIEAATRLAAAYPDIVKAVCVGNETQVFWSGHRVPTELLVRYVREVRVRVGVPVTVADDFNFWNKAESRDVARELDFIVVHMHPLWNGLQLEDALSWTKETFAEVKAMHPGEMVVLGETGWATKKHNVGEQATLIKGSPGEREQKVFFDAFSEWVNMERIPSFFFEAFDENWKGGKHPDEVEKHWGLFRADRRPKLAMAGGR